MVIKVFKFKVQKCVRNKISYYNLQLQKRLFYAYVKNIIYYCSTKELV